MNTLKSIFLENFTPKIDLSKMKFENFPKNFTKISRFRACHQMWLFENFENEKSQLITASKTGNFRKILKFHFWNVHFWLKFPKNVIFFQATSYWKIMFRNLFAMNFPIFLGLWKHMESHSQIQTGNFNAFYGILMLFNLKYWGGGFKWDNWPAVTYRNLNTFKIF